MAEDNDTLVRRFLAAFNTKNADELAPYLHPEVVFLNYGDDEIHGREGVVNLWKAVFENFDRVEFETVHQAVNGDVVIAEQIHGLALPGGPLAPVMNMAVYEIEDGRIIAWRDYTNPAKARELLAA
ncbi:nuclear transport factor 2 family protein [Saccharopolyspora sp. 5N102]|uniref:nuclear transport factor 2 family protein n=1 Tax=Saccharopolyspora sp. 5N102 TaxID=3375155 RepID=UPI003788A9BE